MSNPTELPDLDRIPPSHYSNGPGNVPRLPDRVVDTLIDSAGVSRCAPGRTNITVRDQTAEVEQLVHDVCEELLARLPDTRRAQPEGEAPQADACYGVYRQHPEENDGKEFFFCSMWHNETNWGEGHRVVKGRFVPDSHAPAATLSPLCGAQHAESGKEDKPMFDVETRDELTDAQNSLLDHRNTLQELLICFMCWEPQVCVLGNVRADKAASAIRAALAAQLDGGQEGSESNA